MAAASLTGASPSRTGTSTMRRTIWSVFSRASGFEMTDLAATIDAAWEARDTLSSSTHGPVRQAVEEVLEMLDSGRARVAEKHNGEWVVHQWLKKAVLLSFRLNDMAI